MEFYRFIATRSFLLNAIIRRLSHVQWDLSNIKHSLAIAGWCLIQHRKYCHDGFVYGRLGEGGIAVLAQKVHNIMYRLLVVIEIEGVNL